MANHVILTQLKSWTIEGYSPVEETWLAISISRVPRVGNPLGSRESETPNSKHYMRPIANKYHEGKLKRTRHKESKKNLKPNSYGKLRRFRRCNVPFG